MEYKCPTCDRDFKGMFDYPRISIVKVERMPIEDQSFFKIEDPEIFFGPKVDCGNARPPKQVLEFFKAYPTMKQYEHENWNWVMEAPPLYVGVKEESISDKIFGILCRSKPTRSIEPYQFALYRRYQKGSIGTKTIMNYINPYLGHLENLVGANISPKEVIPNFGVEEYMHGRIPGTFYDLTLQEIDSAQERQTFAQCNLSLPVLETPQCTRKTALVITQCDGGSICETYNLAVVGGLAYEGRLKR